MVSENTAVKTTEDQLRDYELVVVLNPESTEEKIQANVDFITQFITGRGGSVGEVEKWGKKKLAYPIKRFVEGHYFLAHIKMKPKSARELKAQLLITEEVLRHLLIKTE